MFIKESASLELEDSACELTVGFNPGDQSLAASTQNGSLRAIWRFLRDSNMLDQLPRLVREGPSPALRMLIQASNTGQIARFLNQGTPLSFISSFPRSGNTWVRYLISDFFYQCKGVGTHTRLPIHKVVPDYYCDWIALRDTTLPTPGVLVKTHDSFSKFNERYGGSAAGTPTGSRPLRRCKHVYIYRTPEDAFVSFYHYHDRQPHLRAKTAMGIDAFCRSLLSGWEENLASYLSAAEQGIPVLFVPYELLLKCPEATLAGILQWLGAEKDPAKVSRAVFNMQFQKLRAVAGKDSMRRGCPGSGRAELRPSTVREIRERTSDLMARAKQRVIPPAGANW